MESRKGKDRRQSPRILSNDRRNIPKEINKKALTEPSEYSVLPEYADEIEIVEDKSLGRSQSLSETLQDREKKAFEKGEINYTPFQADQSQPNDLNDSTSQLYKEKLKNHLQNELLNEMHPNQPMEVNFDANHHLIKEGLSPELIDVQLTPEEEQIPIKPFHKKRKPGRPSSLPKESESNEWPRKTYRFNKETLKKLKIYQASLDSHQDLSIIINDALSEWLSERL